VLTVTNKTIVMRPSALAAACAPVSATPSAVLATPVLRDRVVDHPAAWRPATADAPQLSQVHQVQSQAELALGAVRTGEGYGINGFTVNGSEMGANKRFVDVARGVPPRGRPV
jgi:hypothetical protein